MKWGWLDEMEGWDIGEERNVGRNKRKRLAEKEGMWKLREKAEREQGFLDSIQRMINARDEASEMISKTNAMLQRDEERRKAHEEKMEWYRRQERKE